MINEEFETMLLAAYGNQEIPPDQKTELRLAFLRGAAMSFTATVAAVLAGTKNNNPAKELHAEILRELKAAAGEGPAILLEPLELELQVVEPPATREETREILDETLKQIDQQP